MHTSADPSPSRRAKPYDASMGLREPRVFNRVARGRFMTERSRSLVRHLGRQPSVAEAILIRRISRGEWDLRRLDARLDDDGDLSPHAMHLRLALENRLRLDLIALGLRGPPEHVPTLAEYLAERDARLAGGIAEPDAEDADV